MKKKILLIMIVVIIFLILVIGVSKMNNVSNEDLEKIQKNLIGKVYGNAEYISYGKTITDTDIWSIKFVDKDNCIVYHEQFTKNSIEPFQFVGIKRYKYVLSSNLKINLVNPDSRTPNSYTLVVDSDNSTRLTSVVDWDKKQTTLSYEDITNDNDINFDNRDGIYYFEEKNMIKINSLFEDIKTRPTESNSSAIIYTYIFSNKEKVDTQYKEYQKILQEDFGFKIEVNNDIAYIYKEEKLVAAMKAGYESKEGYFLKVSFPNNY